MGTMDVTFFAPAAFASAASHAVVATTMGPEAALSDVPEAVFSEAAPEPHPEISSRPALSAVRGRTRTRVRAMREFSVQG